MRRRNFLAAVGLTALTFGEMLTNPAAAVRLAPRSSAATLRDQLQRALLVPGGGRIAPPAALPGVLAAARSDYRATNYASLGNRLSTLISSSEAFVADEPQSHAQGLLARSYNATTTALFKLPASHLEWLSADRAVRAARHAGDPILLAECHRQMATALRRAGRPTEAVEVCVHAFEQLLAANPNADPSVVMCTAAYSAAVAGDRERAYELLHEARRASLNSQAADCWTAAGTANVDVYAVSCGTVLGDHSAALKAISAVHVNALPSTERKARFLVDAAAARAAAEQPMLAARTLNLAGQVAPQEMRTRPAARRLATTLRRAHPETGPTLRAVGL